MRVLVAHGSKMGGTEGIAAMIGTGLAEAGHDVDVRPAGQMGVIDAHDVVVLGGGLYGNRWVKDARRFVRRHRRALRDKEVWLFSSGPLDDSAARSAIPPTEQVQKYMDMVGARGHMTFGGKLDKDVKGFPARAMARDRAGDYRDPDHIGKWVDAIDRALAAAPPSPVR